MDKEKEREEVEKELEALLKMAEELEACEYREKGCISDCDYECPYWN